jgi:hypothetical protein
MSLKQERKKRAYFVSEHDSPWIRSTLVTLVSNASERNGKVIRAQSNVIKCDEQGWRWKELDDDGRSVANRFRVRREVKFAFLHIDWRMKLIVLQ